MDQKLVFSIKAWSVALGVLSLSSLSVFKLFSLMSMEGFLAIVALILGLAVIYAGLKVESMSKKCVNKIFWAKLVWVAVGLVYMFVQNYHNGTAIVIAVAEAVMAVILIMRLKKLVAQPVQGTPAQP